MGRLVIGGEAIRYIVKRTSDAKSVHLRMKPNLELEILMPKSSQVSPKAILRKKRNWIEKKHGEMTSSVKLFDGTRVLYKGAPHRLVAARSTGTRVRVQNRKIVVPVNVGRDLKEALKQWMKSETEKIVRRGLASYSKKYGLSVNGFSVQETRKWAYCTKTGNLAFSWQLVGLPPDLADYVILHEMIHLKEFNHSRRFKYELASVCPDFREKEAMLKRFVAQ